VLILTRKVDERVIIANGDITITVIEIRGDKVRLGITAPRDVPVHREEVQKAVDQEAFLADLKRKREAGE